MAAFWNTENIIFFNSWYMNVWHSGCFYPFLLLRWNYFMTVLLKTLGRGNYSMRSRVAVESE